MKKPLVVTIAAALLPLLAGNVLADDAPPLALGSRVRVTSDHPIVGKLLAIDNQSLTLDLGDAKDPVVVPRGAINRLEQSLGPGRKDHDAAAGAAAGAALAVGLGLAFGVGCKPSLCSSRATGAAQFAGLSAMVLVPSLAALSGLTGGERWRKVPLDRIKIGLAPTRGRGIGAALSFSF
jgi:hypothetical protein